MIADSVIGVHAGRLWETLGRESSECESVGDLPADVREFAPRILSG